MLDFRTRLLWGGGGGALGGRGRDRGKGTKEGGDGRARGAPAGPRRSLRPDRVWNQPGEGARSPAKGLAAEPHGSVTRPPWGPGRRGSSAAKRAPGGVPTRGGGETAAGKGPNRESANRGEGAPAGRALKGCLGLEKGRERREPTCPGKAIVSGAPPAVGRGASAGPPRPLGGAAAAAPTSPRGQTADPRPRPRLLRLCACPGVPPRGGSAPGRLTPDLPPGWAAVGDWAQRGAGPPRTRCAWSAPTLGLARPALPAGTGAALERTEERGVSVHTHEFFFKEHSFETCLLLLPSPTPSLQPGAGRGGPPS